MHTRFSQQLHHFLHQLSPSLANWNLYESGVMNPEEPTGAKWPLTRAGQRESLLLEIPSDLDTAHVMQIQLPKARSKQFCVNLMRYILEILVRYCHLHGNEFCVTRSGGISVESLRWTNFAFVLGGPLLYPRVLFCKKNVSGVKRVYEAVKWWNPTALSSIHFQRILEHPRP